MKGTIPKANLRAISSNWLNTYLAQIKQLSQQFAAADSERMVESCHLALFPAHHYHPRLNTALYAMITASSETDPNNEL